jgi:hypothetical protein
MAAEFSDATLVGDEYGWGQIYGGTKIKEIVGEVKKELSKKRPAVSIDYNFDMLISNIY